MKMRATLGIYEDPTTFTSADIWDGSDAAKVRIYAVVGLLSMAVMTTYATWKYTPFGKSAAR